MSDVSCVEQRVDRIALVSAGATELLSSTKEPTLRAQIQLAMRDLEEAHTWLGQPNVSARPPILQIVDLCIHHAEGRLTIVETALKTHGPNAFLAGPSSSPLKPAGPRP